MIVRTRPGLFTLLFTLRGSILPRVAPKLAGIVAVSCLVVAAEGRWPELFPVAAGVAPFTVVGVALSIFSSFRNNACYDRWWEARKAWGTVISEARGLARALTALLPDQAQAAARARALRGVSAFAHGLRARLRGGDEAAAVAARLPEGPPPAHCPSPMESALTATTAELAALARAGSLTDVAFAILERKIARLSEMHTVCERIENTPVPFAYSLLVYRTAWLYCLLLPVGLSGALGWGTPVIVGLVAYTFFGLDALGDELEEPFGLEPNDLPLDALVRAVDRIVHAALGEPVPDPLAPERHRLR